MADKLVVVEYRDSFRIQWELDDGDDLGAFLGQSTKCPPDKAPENKDDREFWAHERAGFQVIYSPDSEGCGHDHTGFWWETETKAKFALAKVNAMAKAALSEIPWPDWAVKATAAGWKPPKGWKP
jgi:hypothetical protein